VNPAEIDGALGNDRQIEPSAGFRSHVMEAVHACASGGRKRRAGFGHLWPSLAAASAVVPVLIAVRLLDGPETQARDVAEALSCILTATLAVAWWLMRDVVAE
jgi:hypothetical protein